MHNLFEILRMISKVWHIDVDSFANDQMNDYDNEADKVIQDCRTNIHLHAAGIIAVCYFHCFYWQCNISLST